MYSTSLRFSSNNEIQNSEEYIRDNMHQSKKSTLIDFFRADNLGNITKYSRWDENNDIENEYSYNTTFQYNSNNYPILEERVYLNNELVIFSFEYY